MHRFALAALAAGTVALVLPAAATAVPGYVHRGGCDVRVTGDPTGPDVYSGEITVLAVVVADDPATVPGTTTFTCDVLVNGVTQDTLTASGTTVVTGDKQTSVRASDGDVVTLCETVAYPDATSIVTCEDIPLNDPAAVEDDDAWAAYETASALLQPVTDALGTLAGQVAIDVVDPVACDRVLRPLGGVLTDPAAPLYVDSEGDTYLLGGRVWNCPPYHPDGKDVVGLPAYGPGGITISDAGSGLTWRAHGVLANSRRWGCFRDHSMAPRLIVTCRWVGSASLARPRCYGDSATAVALPTSVSGGGVSWGRVRTATLCLTDWVSGFVQTEVADAGTPFRFRQGPALPGAVTEVSCWADNGSTGVPGRAYVADCDWTF